jgi:hypothetical protein
MLEQQLGRAGGRVHLYSECADAQAGGSPSGADGDLNNLIFQLDGFFGACEPDAGPVYGVYGFLGENPAGTGVGVGVEATCVRAGDAAAP